MTGLPTLAAESAAGPADRSPEPADQAAPAEPARARRPGLVAAGRRVLIVFVLAAVGYAAASEWSTVSGTVRALSLGSLLLSGAALVAGLLAATVGWQLVLDGLGPPVGLRRAGQILLVGSLGKYVPGSVWAYVLQMELGRRSGVQRTRILTASIVQTAVSVVASLLLGIIALPLVLKQSPEAGWLYCLLPVGLAVLYPPVLSRLVDTGLRLLRRPGLERPIGYAVVGKTLLCSLVSYGLFGVHLWLLAAAWSRAGAGGVLLCTGAIAVALTVSLFAFILPSGVGLREAVVAAVLSSMMPPARAVAVALVSRLFFTVGDVASAGLAALGVRLSGARGGRDRRRGVRRDPARASGPADEPGAG
ncbi:MAG TPA: lysylphosphatidylglycerol synthase domain-containing protein [Actinocrinis sp.]|nr:lysylphosphatidylglycerol synthase domain-containing protein [Actinocrinis sp.]